MKSVHDRIGWGPLALMAVLLAGYSTVLGQAPARAGQRAKPWTAPKTPWGHPDLQGLWSNATTTPLERPDEHKGKAVLTDQEFEQAAAATAKRRNTDQAPRAGDPGHLQRVLVGARQPPEADVAHHRSRRREESRP